MKELLELAFPIRIVFALLLALAISFLTTPLVKRMASKVGAMDIPRDNRRMHDHPIPRMGGLAIAIAFIFTVLLFTKIDRQMQGILLGSIVLLVLGVFDDSLRLKATPKLIVQLLAAGIAVYHGCTIRYVTNPFSCLDGSYFDLGILSVPVSVIWIVALTNAVNFIDGLDGLAVGVSAISALSMLVISILVADAGVAVTLAALLGACLGFIPYNFNPAKIFMGDTGSTFLGFILATLSIQGMFKLYAIISFVVPFLILGIPIFDICFAVIRRLIRHQNPMTADRGHIHHCLIDMGFSQKQTVAITYILSGTLGLAAVLLTTSSEMKVLILIASVVIVAALGILLVFGPHKKREEPEKEEVK
ncbi:MAG: MraY family glycosyltransferase [Faecousia sp.]